MQNSPSYTRSVKKYKMWTGGSLLGWGRGSTFFSIENLSKVNRRFLVLQISSSHNTLSVTHSDTSSYVHLSNFSKIDNHPKSCSWSLLLAILQMYLFTRRLKQGTVPTVNNTRRRWFKKRPLFKGMVHLIYKLCLKAVFLCVKYNSAICFVKKLDFLCWHSQGRIGYKIMKGNSGYICVQPTELGSRCFL